MKMPPPDEFERIAAEIRLDGSPVGFDALKTHVIILHKLGEIEARLTRLEAASNVETSK